MSKLFCIYIVIEKHVNKKNRKMDAIFFNKIDNYLMALMGRGSVREVFQKYWPDFLYEEPIELPEMKEKQTPTDKDDPEPITRKKSGTMMERQMSNSSMSNAYHLAAKQSTMFLGLASASPAAKSPSPSPGGRISSPGGRHNKYPALAGHRSSVLLNSAQFKSMIHVNAGLAGRGSVNTMAKQQSDNTPYQAYRGVPSNSKLSMPTSSRQGTAALTTIDSGHPDDEYDTPNTRPSKMMRQLMGDAPHDNAPKISKANMSTVTINQSFKYDVLDKLADKLCVCAQCRGCKTWIHNLQRVYIAILVVIVIVMTAGCLFANFWYFNGSTSQTTQAMELAIQSIGERARNQLVFQYWVPQLFTGYLISGLETGAYTIDAAEDTEFLYDEYFAGFKDVSNSDAMFSIYMYNVDDNLMMGAYRVGNETRIRTVIDDCAKNYTYLEDEQRRDISEDPQCKMFDATTRSWYQQSRNMSLGESQWTEPYEFYFTEQYGMSLVSRMVLVNGTEVIFLAEITAETMKSVVSVPNLPDGTVSIVVTSGGSVITSTDDQIVVGNTTIKETNDGIVVDTVDPRTKTTLQHFAKEVKYIRDYEIDIDVDSFVYQGQDSYMDGRREVNLEIFAFSFYMMYIDFLNMTNIALYDRELGEVGFIVFSYDDSYLSDIYWSFYIGASIFGIMLFVSCLIVCLNIKTDMHHQQETVGMATRAVSIGQVRRTGSIMHSITTANLFQPHHSNASFQVPNGGTFRNARKASKLRESKIDDANGAIEEEDEDDSEFSTSEEEKDEEQKDENQLIKKVFTTINEEDENLEEDEEDMMDIVNYADHILNQPSLMNMNTSKDSISKASIKEIKDEVKHSASGIEESHHFDSKSTDMAIMKERIILKNQSVTEETDRVLDGIYDKVIEDSKSEVKVTNKPFQSGKQKRSYPIKEEEEMTPRAVNMRHKFSRDTVMSASETSPEPTSGNKLMPKPTAPPEETPSAPPEEDVNGDNILNLPINSSPETSPANDTDPSPTTKLENSASMDSNSPLKGDNDNGRTDNMPETVPEKRKLVSFGDDVKFNIQTEATPVGKNDPLAPGPDNLNDTLDYSPIEIPGVTTPWSSARPAPEEEEELHVKYCNCSPKTIIIIGLILLMLTFISTIGVWIVGTTFTSNKLIDDLMVKQEYFAVSDEVYKIFGSSDMVYDLLSQAIILGEIELDYSDMTPSERDATLQANDFLFTRFMKVFAEPSAKYRQFYIFCGAANGNFQGARWANGADDGELLIGARDPDSTDNVYIIYRTDPETGLRTTTEFSDNAIYDPRCRGWYIKAVQRGFVGNITQAFPTLGGFKAFYENETGALDSPACRDAKESYIELFNLEDCTYGEDGVFINFNAVDCPNIGYVLNGDKNESEIYTISWSRYVFASLGAQGLTAAAPIMDPITGELLAVVAVDYTLDGLSVVLEESVGILNESDWHAWIFEANTEKPYMIASSDGYVLIEADTIDGCLQLAETSEQVPALATEHNNSIISIMSKEIVEVYGLSYIAKLTVESLSPQSLQIPIDLPLLEVGRIRYYQEENKQNDSIDWIISKTINTENIESGESNDMTICGMCLLMLTTVTMIMFREFKVSKKKHKGEDGTINPSEYDQEDLEEMQYNPEDRLGYFRKMNKMKPIIEGSANKLWEMACEGFSGIITTKAAKDFMAQRANQHVSANEHNNFMFLMCALEYRDQWNRLKFLQFMDSNWYSVPMQFIIITHLVITIFEPSTPLKLKTHGTDSALLIVIGACIVFEAIDVFLIGCQRYMEFTVNPSILKQLYQLNYGYQHKYCKLLKKFRDRSSNESIKEILKLIYFGPGSARYLCHTIVFCAILINFLLQWWMRVSPFAYYLPVLPILIIIKNEHILLFLDEFFFAVNYARDVLFSYVCFIMIFSVFGVSLFGETVNVEQSADSFKSIQQAFITSFVYISTSENYDDIVYSTIDAPYYKKKSWIILANAIFISILFVVLGLFIFIPMIIHKFEEAFSEKKILAENENNNQKMNAIIAAFIMLDMNGDMGIDMDEFQHLVTHSILINKNKMMQDAFNYFDDDGSEELDLYEFTNHLLTQQFRDKLFVTTTQIQNKVQAWLECNIFRRYRIHIVILLLSVMPAFTVSLLQNLKGINDNIFDGILILCFIMNFVEIHLRWFAFGYNRYFDLKRFPNPPYVVAAISKYTKMSVEAAEKSDDDLIIRLSSSQRNWAVHNLRDTRPLSNLDKSTLSLIHRIEFSVIWFTLLSWLILTFGFGGEEEFALADPRNYDTQGYQRYFLQLGILIRIFTLLRSNQKIIYIVFTVFSAFASLFAFLFLLIYTFARVGCTLFDKEFAIVIDEIYPVAESIIASFDNTGSAMLTLLQLMIGEGWHEIMYLHMIAQTLVLSIYFIIYIMIVTIIISNVFVGLFLSDVDELKKMQTDDELKKKFNKSKNFKAYAINQLEKLNYQLNKTKAHQIKMEKQIREIVKMLEATEVNEQQKQQISNAQQMSQITAHTQFNMID